VTTYLSVIEVVALHAMVVEATGGSHGLRDAGALEAALYRPQTGYYDDVVAQAAALLESLAVNHPFVDGNKRIALLGADVFLRLNGLRIGAEPADVADHFWQLFEQNRFAFEELEPWLRSVVEPHEA
jgi:death-on-curing protein